MAAKGRLLNNSLPGNWNQKGGKDGPGPGIESLFLQISHRIRFRLPPSSEPLPPPPPRGSSQVAGAPASPAGAIFRMLSAVSRLNGKLIVNKSS